MKATVVVPLTGTVIDYDPKTNVAKGDQIETGEPLPLTIPLGQQGNDPIRQPDGLNLGDVLSRTLAIDIEAGTMTLEIEGDPAAVALANVRVDSKTHAEHLAASGNKPLRLTPDVVVKIKKAGEIVDRGHQ